jgi:ATP-dependent Clp protease adaptor protein ClpS
VSEPRRETAPGTATVERTELAPRYRVVVHNDDVTPMFFVVQVLGSIFHLDRAQAERTMLEAHTSGVAHVVTLSLEEAEVRCERAHSLARTHGYPLTFTYEPES